MKRKVWVLFILYLLSYSPIFAQEKVTTILLVRHAEKSTVPADDPVLTAQGSARAELLVRMFENSGLTAIYSSQFARTRLTAEPIARKLGMQTQIVDADATKALVDSILARHSGGTVLVVGHSNTLPEIVQVLGAGKMAEINDLDYDNLYVVTVIRKGNAKLVGMKFFAPSGDEVCQ